MAKSFVDGVRTPIRGLVESAHNLTYLPWPTAVALAERPNLRVVTFGGGLPYLEFLGSLVVAVDGDLENGDTQRVWLPVMDARHNAVRAAEANARDIGDAISRCRAKAVAMIHGVGMSLYCGHGEDLGAFHRALGVRPDTDLSTVDPVVSKKPGSSGAAYVDWGAAYTAAKITDPEFRFEVLMFDEIDTSTGEVRPIPAKRVMGGYMVAVSMTYKGQSHTEWLPIMGVLPVQTKNGLKKMDHQPLPNPDTHDWNRAVMRCLTRGIATLTGYGLSVYAGEDVESLHREPAGSRPAQVEQAPDPAAVNDVPVEGVTPAPAEEAAAVAEPPAEVVATTLKRIGNINALPSVIMAREQLTSKFKGTKALNEFLAALQAKEAALKAAA